MGNEDSSHPTMSCLCSSWVHLLTCKQAFVLEVSQIVFTHQHDYFHILPFKYFISISVKEVFSYLRLIFPPEQISMLKYFPSLVWNKETETPLLLQYSRHVVRATEVSSRMIPSLPFSQLPTPSLFSARQSVSLLKWSLSLPSLKPSEYNPKFMKYHSRSQVISLLSTCNSLTSPSISLSLHNSAPPFWTDHMEQMHRHRECLLSPVLPDCLRLPSSLQHGSEEGFEMTPASNTIWW